MTTRRDVSRRTLKLQSVKENGKFAHGELEEVDPPEQGDQVVADAHRRLGFRPSRNLPLKREGCVNNKKLLLLLFSFYAPMEVNQYQIPRSIEPGKCAPVFLEEGLYMSFIAKHPTNDLLYII
jgi:hypothetical protein